MKLLFETCLIPQTLLAMQVWGKEHGVDGMVMTPADVDRAFTRAIGLSPDLPDSGLIV